MFLNILKGIIYSLLFFCTFSEQTFSVFLITADDDIERTHYDKIFTSISQCSFPYPGLSPKKIARVSQPKKGVQRELLEKKLSSLKDPIRGSKVQEIPHIIWNLYHSVKQALDPKYYPHFFTASKDLSTLLASYGDSPTLENYQHVIWEILFPLKEVKPKTSEQGKYVYPLKKGLLKIEKGQPNIFFKALEIEFKALQNNQVVFFRSTNGLTYVPPSLKSALQEFENRREVQISPPSDDFDSLYTYECFKSFIEKFKYKKIKYVLDHVDDSLIESYCIGGMLQELKSSRIPNYIDKDGRLDPVKISPWRAVEFYHDILVLCTDNKEPYCPCPHEEMNALYDLEFSLLDLPANTSPQFESAESGKDLLSSKRLSYSYDILDGYIHDGATHPNGQTACTYIFYLNQEKYKYCYCLVVDKELILNEFRKFFYLGDLFDHARILGSGEKFHPSLAFEELVYGSPEINKTMFLQLYEFITQHTQVLSIDGEIIPTDDPNAEKLLQDHRALNSYLKRIWKINESIVFPTH